MPTEDYKGQCITVIGTASIQQFIFSSNRLKENIGGSDLVSHWLENGLMQAMETIDCTDWHACLGKPGTPAPPNPDGQVIYFGGGNAALIFKNKETAKQKVYAWSQRVLREAPGLRLAVGHAVVENSLSSAYQQALKKLADCENALPFGAPLQALPVVRACNTTGYPASEKGDATGEFLSAGAWRKRQRGSTNGEAQQAIQEAFGTVLQQFEYKQFAVELEDLGGREGESHIAVVHADGNGIGKLLQDVIESNTDDDAAFLKNLRGFSASVSQVAFSAFQTTLTHLGKVLPDLDGLSTKNGIFPVRPLVYGGDDLTFVCDARIGLSFTAHYLRLFSQKKIDVNGEQKPVDACAGVAIVPTKFPFARAYKFSEELCANAKKKRQKEADDEKGSWLDFQIVMEGATGSVEQMRDLNYLASTGDALCQRPYRVTGTDANWQDFVSQVKAFQKWPRSRAKGLLQALAQGPESTRQWLKAAYVRNLKLPGPKMSQTDGWTGGNPGERKTPYFDPLEALDLYLDLESQKKDDEQGGSA